MAKDVVPLRSFRVLVSHSCPLTWPRFDLHLSPPTLHPDYSTLSPAPLSSSCSLPPFDPFVALLPLSSSLPELPLSLPLLFTSSPSASRCASPAMSSTSKTVLVTGANGYLGSAVVQHCLEHGYHVRGTVRSQAKADRSQGQGPAAGPVRAGAVVRRHRRHDEGGSV